MRRFFLSIQLVLMCVLSYGQLQGSFQYAQDGHLYFYLSNPTGYQIPITWGVYNDVKKEQRVTQGVMGPYFTFTYGPNANWLWEKGERFCVTYSNGQTVYWTCPSTDPALKRSGNPSFGNNWISVSVPVSKCSGEGSRCSCRVYKGYKRAGLSQYKGDCTNYVLGHKCGHGPAAHGLSAY